MSSGLPIESLRAALRQAAQHTRRLVIQAPTGSGKSTQIPQYLIDDALVGDGQVVVLQPRRLATRLLATRVAYERNVKLGDAVGYQVRFEDVSSPRTRIKFETEGIILRQWLSDPQLKHVSAIVFDEFHERHLYADIALARALHLQQTVRPDLMLVVMSATLDIDPLCDYLGPGSVALTASGRQYPVDIQYIDESVGDRTDAIVEAAVRVCDRLIRQTDRGDVLIFMPGAFEIQRTVRALQSADASRDCLILPLHGELPPHEQDAAVGPSSKRKIIVSTNVAETSLTIDGIELVIDSGWARVPRFDPHRSINTLFLERISRASADQRAGRAGRTAPGTCVRLWTERDHQERALHEVPEINRLDLAEATLGLSAAGLPDPLALPWFECPPARALTQAQRLLGDLGALAEDGSITDLGRLMAQFPVHPRYARMLIAARDFGCVRQVALVCALTQGRSIWATRGRTPGQRAPRERFGEAADSDFFAQMRAWSYAVRHRFDVRRCREAGVHAAAARQIDQVYRAFLRLAESHGFALEARAGDDAALCRCVLVGFADHVCRRRGTGTLQCDVAHGRRGMLVRDSIVQDAPLLVATEIDEIQTGREHEVRLSNMTRVEADWLTELLPHAMHEQLDIRYDVATKQVIQEIHYQYHDLILATRPGGAPAADAAAHLLADEVERGRIVLRHWDAQVEAWLARVNFLADFGADYGFSAIGPTERRLLIEQICLGCTRMKEVAQKPVWPVIHAWLPTGLLPVLKKEAPERLAIAGTRTFRLYYPEQGTPYFEARIQELFGVKSIPMIGFGHVQPLVHILAPNQRPVQITQDLAGFWLHHYPGIRQELKRRYPKHAWPERGEIA